jgi:hypothetical protein
LYSYLDFDIQNPVTPWTASYFALPGVAEQLQPDLEKARRNGATILVKLKVSGLSDDAKAALVEQVCAVVRHLPDYMTSISFEMHMALAHCRLDDATRTRREQRIAAIMAPYFAGDTPAAVQQQLRRVKTVAVMVPDAALEVVLRSQVILTNRSIAAVAYGQVLFREPLRLFDEICAAAYWEDPRFKQALQACYFGRLPNDRPACLTLIRQARAASLDKMLPQLLDGLAKREKDLLGAEIGDAVFTVLQAGVALAAQNLDAHDIDTLVAVALDRLAAERSARCSEIVLATKAAMEQGVLFDPASMARNTTALAASAKAQALAKLGMTAPRVRKVLAQARPTTAQKPDEQAPDLDPIHARSVEWLVRWIEGPATSNDAPQRLNRQKIAAEESQTRLLARKAAGQATPDPHGEEDLTEKDVDLVWESGLSGMADFLLGDIHDMVVRAKHVKVAPELLTACTALVEPLQALILHPSTDELQARDLLQRAESAIESLRRGVLATEVTERVHQRFTGALNQALRQEPLVYGKRHGGVIACPMRQADWGWVHQTFHQRWLPVQRLEMDGLLVPLQADQALALYVTGSSQSQYAFDVSVHLWCRKPGGGGLPSLEVGAYPPMNTRDWRDTRVPCAVLHVPPA